MRIAYLVNQYPTVSHTFIRREIAGVERVGHEVTRVSLQPMDSEAMPDPLDRAERARTYALLERGPAGLVPALERTMRKRPRAFARALSLGSQIGWKSERGLIFNYGYLMEACALLELCEQRRIDHVHAHFGTNSAAVAMLTQVLGGPSYSFTVHGPEEFDKASLLHLDDKIARAAFVVGVSSFGRSQLYRYTPLADWPKIKVVRCGVDEAFLNEPITQLPTAPRLVCVGRLCEQKGQLLLVEAAAALHRAGVPFELVLVGDGPMRGAVEELIAREGLSQQVQITGWAEGERVRDEIRRARAMVLPSFAEGLPVVIMEALALGRPVITTYIAGIPELVRHGESGYLVPAGSVSALVTAMRVVLAASVDELSRLGACGRERVREEHDAGRNAAILAGYFAQLTTKSGGGA